MHQLSLFIFFFLAFSLGNVVFNAQSMQATNHPLDYENWVELHSRLGDEKYRLLKEQLILQNNRNLDRCVELYEQFKFNDDSSQESNSELTCFLLTHLAIDRGYHLFLNELENREKLIKNTFSPLTKNATAKFIHNIGCEIISSERPFILLKLISSPFRDCSEIFAFLSSLEFAEVLFQQGEANFGMSKKIENTTRDLEKDFLILNKLADDEIERLSTKKEDTGFAMKHVKGFLNYCMIMSLRKKYESLSEVLCNAKYIEVNESRILDSTLTFLVFLLCLRDGVENPKLFADPLPCFSQIPPNYFVDFEALVYLSGTQQLNVKSL